MATASDISGSEPLAVPPKIPAAGLGWFALGLMAVAGVVLGVVVFFFNPSTHPFYPICQFHRLTGWNCPGCGATRGLYALLHGHPLVAARDNVLLVAAVVLLPLRGAWWQWRRRTGDFLPAAWLWPLLALMLVFSVLRNFPAFAFLSPA